RFDDLAHGVPGSDVEHERVDFGGGLRPEHGRTARNGVPFKYFQPDVEVFQRTIADCLPGVAGGLEIVQLDNRLPTIGNELALDLLQILLEHVVVQPDVRSLLEVHRCHLHAYSSAPCPASTSAKCSTLVFMSPRRRIRPSMLSMHPRSPSTTA